MIIPKVLILATLAAAVSGSAIPIWELLSHDEKMGRLMYVFMHLVTQYCQDTHIPDCKKVLTLYGLSSLVGESDDTINLLDPYQRNSKTLIWDRVMKGDFKLPQQKLYTEEDLQRIDANDYDSINEIDNGRDYVHQKYIKNSSPNDPHPYAIRVPPPAKFLASTTTRPFTTESISLTETTPIQPTDVDPYELYLGSRNSEFAASHPYAVRALPPSDETNLPPNYEPYSVRALPPNHVPSGIKHSADFEPMMSESQPNQSVFVPGNGQDSYPYIQILPSPISNPWVRKSNKPRFS